MDDYESIDYSTDGHVGDVRVGDYLWRHGLWVLVTDIYISVNSEGYRVVSLHGADRGQDTHLASDMITVHQYPDWLTRQRNGR